MDEQQIEIIDNLISTLTDAALSARQGKVLKGYIDEINETLDSIGATETATNAEIDAIFA